MEVQHQNNQDPPPPSPPPRVGLVYDERMCKHSTPDGEDHPENPLRIKAIWEKLKSAGITQRCVVLGGKEADDRHIALVHTQRHIDLIRKVSSKAYHTKRRKIAAKFNSIYLNEGSSEAAYLAAGSVIEASDRVATGELRSAVAIVRPPGHHAEADEAMGFCLYNNVAIAASFLLNERPELDIKKILIVDWDVHHGNGTQKMFWKDPRVLFFSVHRFDFGTFYPTGDDGSYTMIGEGLGAGYNINVPWEQGRCGDADYLAVWEHILIPVARAFRPDIVLISGGFDAALGDPLGGCRITPYGYSVMMQKLMEFAQGKIVMALEGGYNLDSIANSVLACVKALLEDKPIIGSSEVYPFESTWRVIQAVRGELSAFWPTLAAELPKTILLNNNKTSPFELIPSSDSDTENDEEVNNQSIPSEVYNVEVVQNVVQNLSMLKGDEATRDRPAMNDYKALNINGVPRLKRFARATPRDVFAPSFPLGDTYVKNTDSGIQNPNVAISLLENSVLESDTIHPLVLEYDRAYPAAMQALYHLIVLLQHWGPMAQRCRAAETKLVKAEVEFTMASTNLSKCNDSLKKTMDALATTRTKHSSLYEVAKQAKEDLTSLQTQYNGKVTEL